MTAVEIIEQCRCAGVTLTPNGDRVRMRSPHCEPEPALVEAVRSHKPAILALLAEAANPPRVRAHWCVGCGAMHFPEPATLCYGCRSVSPRGMGDLGGGVKPLKYFDANAEPGKIRMKTYRELLDEVEACEKRQNPALDQPSGSVPNGELHGDD